MLTRSRRDALLSALAVTAGRTRLRVAESPPTDAPGTSLCSRRYCRRRRSWGDLKSSATRPEGRRPRKQLRKKASTRIAESPMGEEWENSELVSELDGTLAY